MTDDLVTRIRNFFEDTPQIMTWFDEETYVGAETRAHISGMWETLKEAADRIEHLERELGEERHSREVAAAKGWEFSDRIKELEKKIAVMEVGKSLAAACLPSGYVRQTFKTGTGDFAEGGNK
jgi:hypothetical protein